MVHLLLVASLLSAPLAVPDMWQDQTAEFLDRCVPAGDGFPKALSGGALYYAGPSLWSLGSQETRHSFDGLGRLHRFYHVQTPDGPGKLCHSARFIGGPGADAILSSCDLTSAGAFARVSNASWWAMLPMGSMLASNLDNTWVNQLAFAGRLELMTDTSDILVADHESLEVTKKVTWQDKVVTSWMPVPPLSTAHPVIHPDTGEAYNILLDPGAVSNEVVLFRRRADVPEERIEVARVAVGHRLLIQHSWALGGDFALIFAHPMFLDPVAALVKGDMIAAMKEQPSLQNYTDIFVMALERNSLSKPRSFRIMPFINVHVVNAYRATDDRGTAIIVDLEGRPTISEDTESFYGAFRMDNVRKPQEEGSSYYKEHFLDRKYGLYRVELPLSETPGSEPHAQALHTSPLVFPQISPHVRSRQHCFVWAAEGGGLVGADVTLVKLGLCETSLPAKLLGKWSLEDFVLVAEASFVPSGNSQEEDAGWLLAPLQESKQPGRGALAVVDASSMATVCLTYLQDGDVLNWGAHSTFLATGAAQQREETRLGNVEGMLRRCASQSESSKEL